MAFDFLQHVFWESILKGKRMPKIVQKIMRKVTRIRLMVKLAVTMRMMRGSIRRAIEAVMRMERRIIIGFTNILKQIPRFRLVSSQLLK